MTRVLNAIEIFSLKTTQRRRRRPIKAGEKKPPKQSAL